jgi:methionyl aminopeptidase
MFAARRRPKMSAKHHTGPILKSAAEIEAMAAAGAALAECLDLVCAAATVGATLLELDGIAEAAIRERRAIPAFLGYPGGPGAPDFPGSICSSLNDVVVHGIPSPVRLEDGDLLAIDCGLILDGWVADSARTVAIGSITAEAAELKSVTETALQRGIAAAQAGNTVGDIGAAVQAEVEAAGFQVVRSLVGHGVGRSMHEEPQVPNYGTRGQGPRLEPGIVIAIEPMVNIGTPDVTLDDDRWTVRTADGSLSAHSEHTIAITADGPRILTTR